MDDSLLLNVKQILQYPTKVEAAPSDAFLLQNGGLGGPYQTTNAVGIVQGAFTQGGFEWEIAGFLDIGENLNVRADAFVEGALTVAGDSVFQGALSVVGDLLTDGNFAVAGQAAIDGDLIVEGVVHSNGVECNGLMQVNADIDVNGDIIGAQDLRITGNGLINQSLTVNGQIFGTALSITGGACFGGPVGMCDDVAIAGELWAGTNAVVGGDLQVNGTLSADTFGMDNLSIAGNLIVGGEGTFGSLFGTSLAVSGGACFAGPVGMCDDAAVAGELFVAGAIIGNSDLEIATDGTFGGNVTASGDGDFGGALSVAGVASIGGALTAASGAFSGPVSGTTGTFSGQVSGASAIFTGPVTAPSINLGGGFSASGPISATGLTVTGNGSVSGTFQVGGNTTLGGTLGVSGLASLATLTVTGQSTLGNTTIGNANIAAGQASLATLGVTGQATLNGASVQSVNIAGGSATLATLAVTGQSTLHHLDAANVSIADGSATLTTLHVTGPATLDDMHVNNVDIGDELTVERIHARNLLVTEDGEIHGQLDVDGFVSANGERLAPLHSPEFTGMPRGPTPEPHSSDDKLATTAFVLGEIAHHTAGVASWNHRSGHVELELQDVVDAGGAPNHSPHFTGWPEAETAAPGTATRIIASTEFVHNAIDASRENSVLSFNHRVGHVVLSWDDVEEVGAAPLRNPSFLFSAHSPTPDWQSDDTNIATTAWVRRDVDRVADEIGQESERIENHFQNLYDHHTVWRFNQRSGDVTLTHNDILAAGGAPLISPHFQGEPTAPTPPPGTCTDQLATTDFVCRAIHSNPGPVGPAGPRGESGPAGRSWRIVGSVEHEHELPPHGNEAGDVMLVENSGEGWVWDIDPPPPRWKPVGHIRGAKGEQGERGPMGLVELEPPHDPEEGTLWRDDGLVKIRVDDEWEGLGYLPLDGGTLEGPLTLHGNATQALEPVTLQQMNGAGFATQTWVGNQNFATQAALAGYLPLSGGTLTGLATLNLNTVNINVSGQRQMQLEGVSGGGGIIRSYSAAGALQWSVWLNALSQNFRINNALTNTFPFEISQANDLVTITNLSATLNANASQPMQAVPLQQLQAANSYSTTEQPTGGTWIDGKPIYRKTITTTSYGGPHGIIGLDNTVRVFGTTEGMIMSSSGVGGTLDLSSGYIIQVDQTNVVLQWLGEIFAWLGIAVGNSPTCTVTIEYTKF